MAKRILYVGDFDESFSTENYVTYGFEQLGYEVLRAPEGQIKSARQVLGAAMKYEVEFVLFSKGHFPGSEEVLTLLSENKIVSVGWLYDLFFDVPTFFGRRKLTNNAFRADICCMTDGGHQLQWQAQGVNHKTLRQGIHEPEAVYGKRTSGKPEIVFFGTYSYQARIAMVDFLRQTYGDNFIHYGRGGNIRPVRGMALNDVIASANIIIGDSMPSPYYWSNRIYEMLGRGGFLIHPYVQGLEEEFTDGTHYVSFPYGNMGALKEKIDYYLQHDVERQRIKAAGHDLVKSRYTYQKRCEQLLTYVAEFKQYGRTKRADA